MLTSLKKISRTTALLASLAAAGIIAASVFTIQANTAQAETASQIAQSMTGINGTLADQTGAITEAHAEQLAESTIADANAVVEATKEKVDTTPLTASVASLADYRELEPATVVVLASYTESKAEKITAEAAEADRVAAVKEAERAAAAAEKLRVGNTPDGARATAAALASSRYGWGSGEFSCLNQLWQKESGWSYTAHNASSGATGIPQALPGSKMATAGSDWATNATTQISWGLDYIDRAYGSPCAAWSHSQAVNWY